MMRFSSTSAMEEMFDVGQLRRSFLPLSASPDISCTTNALLRMPEIPESAREKQNAECGRGIAMRKFETGATRDVDTNKYDYEGFLHPSVLEAYAEYMHRNRVQADGNLRDSDNWQKGIPLNAYMKSMFRHFMSVWKGHRSGQVNVEELCALMFNVMGYLFETLKVHNAHRQEAEDIAERLSRVYPLKSEEIWEGLDPHNYREHFSNPQPPSEGELIYEDYAPGYHTSLSTLPGMERSEVLGVCPQRTQSEVDAMAPEVRCSCGSEAGVCRAK